MTTENLIKWEPVQGIAFPCADISFQSRNREGLVLVLHFSLVVGNPKKDLKLTFRNAICLRWEEEAGVWLIQLPKHLPRIPDYGRNGCTFPLLEVKNSKLLTEVSQNGQLVQDLRHFVLIALNDTVEILANSDTKTEWVDPVQSPNPLINRIAQKLRYLVSSALHALTAGHFKR